MTQSSFEFTDPSFAECKSCKETKSLSEFYKTNAGTKTGRYGSCKVCHSKTENLTNKLKRGFSSLMPDNCECCNKAESKLQVDHCHDTGMFRGFLCRSCNQTIGKNGDTYDSIKVSDRLDRKYLSYMKTANQRMGIAKGGN